MTTTVTSDYLRLPSLDELRLNSCSDLDDVVARCDASIQAIRRFKASVIRLKNDCTCWTHRLPRELLDIIMIFARNASGRHDFGFLIASVCATWRDAALANPFLWSRVVFLPGRITHGGQMKFLSFSTRTEVFGIQLGRSCGAPVRVDFQNFEAGGFESSTVFTQLLLVAQLDSLVLDAEHLNTYSSNSESGQQLTWPSLRSLTVQGRMYGYKACTLFLDSPRLTHVSLFHEAHKIQLPWSQVKNFELSSETGLSNISSLICPNMTSFKFHSFDPWDREGNRAILFPAFRSHDLWDRSVIIFPATVKAVQLHPGAMNLNGLTFPGVQKLELDCLSVKPDQLLDRNFLQGPIHSTESSSIRELLFTNWDFPRGTLLKFLLIVPNLEVLSISGEAQSTDSFTDALIRLSSDDVPSMAAPRLRAFIVRSHQANSLNWKRLVGFVKKRSRSQGGNLEYLELIFKKNELVHRVYVIREEKKNELRGLARPLDGFAVLVE